MPVAAATRMPPAGVAAAGVAAAETMAAAPGTVAAAKEAVATTSAEAVTAAVAWRAVMAATEGVEPAGVAGIACVRIAGRLAEAVSEARGGRSVGLRRSPVSLSSSKAGHWPGGRA